MSQKVAERKAPAAAGHKPAFREIIGLIAAARRRAFQAVNMELIDLYWRVTPTFVAPVVRQISRRSKVAALLRQIQPTAKTLGTAERIEMDARPHPCPTAIELATKGAQSQPRRGVIFVVTAPQKTKLRRSDIVSFMPPLRGFGDWACRFYKDATPTEFTEIRSSHFSGIPLLGGEGQGEGGREHHFLVCLP